jgi:hypothetical protein
MMATGVVVALLVLAGAVALVTINELNTHSDLRTVRHSLMLSRQELSKTQAKLSSTEHQLRGNEQQLQKADQDIDNLESTDTNQSTLLQEAHACASAMITVSNDINQALGDVLNDDYVAAQQDEADASAEGTSSDYTSNCGALGITFTNG